MYLSNLIILFSKPTTSKLNFLNAVRGENSLNIGVGSFVNRNLSFLPPSMDVARVIVSPLKDVFEEGYTHWQSTIVRHFVGPKLPFLVRSMLIEFRVPLVY